MADVAPFRAIRYAHPSPAVTAPPYDVLDAGGARATTARATPQRRPPDAERLRGRGRRGCSGPGSTRAFSSRTTSRPSGRWPRTTSGRTGSRAAARASSPRSRVEPYATGTVLPHERTHAGPKEGRLRLLRAARAQLEPIFLLYDGEPPVAVPDREPDLVAGDTRLWRLPGEGVAEAFADRQLLIADGHHRYETALAYAEEQGTPESARMMVVLVSTSDPGLEIFPTHRLFRGHEEALPPAGVGDSAPPAAAVERLARLPYTGPTRSAIAVARPSRLSVSRASSTSSSSIGSSATRGSATRRISARRRPGRRRRVRRRVPAPRDAHRGRLRARPPRRGDAAEDDVLLPEAHERPALPPGMTATVDWLALCRACVADIDRILEALPTQSRAGAGAPRGRGRRRYDRDRCCRRGCGGDAARGARGRLSPRLGGARGACIRVRRPDARRRRPDRRLGEREARDPVLRALPRRRRRADDGRRHVRLRLRLRRPRGVGCGAGRRSPAERPSADAGRRRRTRSRSSPSRRRRPPSSRRRLQRCSASRSGCG